MTYNNLFTSQEKSVIEAVVYLQAKTPTGKLTFKLTNGKFITVLASRKHKQTLDSLIPGYMYEAQFTKDEVTHKYRMCGLQDIRISTFREFIKSSSKRSEVACAIV